MTTKLASEQSGIPASLINAVIRQIGDPDSLADVARYGASGGYCGFTYYSDTVAFFKRHREAIRGLVEEMANQLGEEPLVMVAHFNCLKPCDNEDRASIARCLYGGRLKDENTNVANALAWFALEEVARAMNPDL
jgi:hypothetical protein